MSGEDVQCRSVYVPPCDAKRKANFGQRLSMLIGDDDLCLDKTREQCDKMLVCDNGMGIHWFHGIRGIERRPCGNGLEN